jgi:hypothetical protein
MSTHLLNRFDQGLTPQQFIENMTKNQDKFLAWYQTFSWDQPEDQQFFESFPRSNQLRCLILASDWCGDVVRNVPVVFQLMKAAGIPTKVLIMEEHLDVMDQFLTMGGRSIPVVLFLDTDGKVLGKWGPRPRHIQAIMEEFKAQYPDREAPDYEEKLAETRKRLVAAYGEDGTYQHSIVKEIRRLLETI